MTTEELAAVEQRLREEANAPAPESWKPNPGDELTGRVAKYDKAYTARGDHAWIMVIESLRAPGRFVSVWLLHTTLRNKVIEQQPKPGEIVFLRYEGLQQPKHGGEEYHGWKLAIDRDEVADPTFGFPWQDNVDPRTAADEMTPRTGPPTATVGTVTGTFSPDGHDASYGPVEDDIPF